jgi:two-component system, chemotaxis family, chemotaxis protein CheY
MRLMIVDDSNMIRNRIARLLQSPKLSHLVLVAMARDGEEAIRLAKSTKPQLVTMDITMPNVDGLQCIRQLVNMDPDVAILVVSALDDKTTAISAIKSGARGFVAKPFGDEELQMAMLTVIEDNA